MAHEQLSAPRSGIDQDLHDLESFPDEERFLFLRQMIFHPMVSGEIARDKDIHRVNALSRDLYATYAEWKQYDASKPPVDPSLPTEFVLPETPSPLNGDDRSFDSLRELPAFPVIDDVYETNEHLLVRVPQCYMQRIPKEKNPYLYLSMSECSAIVAHTENEIYVAHISYSLMSQAASVMQYFKDNGVSLDDIRIVGNTSDADEADLIWPSKERRLMTEEAFLGLGISKENFVGFSDSMIDGTIRPITEVVVDKNGLFVDQAHYDGRRLDSDVLWSKYQAVNN